MILTLLYTEHHFCRVPLSNVRVLWIRYVTEGLLVNVEISFSFQGTLQQTECTMWLNKTINWPRQKVK